MGGWRRLIEIYFGKEVRNLRTPFASPKCERSEQGRKVRLTLDCGEVNMTTTMHEKFDFLLQTEGDHECEGLGKDQICVRIVAMAELPTRFGDFHIIAFENNRDGKEHVA